MKSLLTNKRYAAIFSIAVLAISIGAISKKFIYHPTGGCKEGVQKMTLKKKIDNFFIL